MTRRFVLPLAVLLLRCGGSAPTAPPPVTTTTTLPPVLSVRDGATEQPVSAEVTPPSPTVGTAVSVRAPGYLVREQRFAGPPIFLWPSDDSSYENELVYDWEFSDDTRRLVRWERGFTVTLDGDLAQDDAIVAKTQEVIAEMSRTTGLVITLGANGACVVGIDPSLAEDNAVGQADLDFRGATVIGARVTFVNRREISGGARADYANTLLHEMGHVLGLGHSPSTRDVMTPGSGPGTRVANYQPDEALCLRMMYFRRTAGNIFPDREPALGAASLGQPRRTVITDYRR